MRAEPTFPPGCEPDYARLELETVHRQIVWKAIPELVLGVPDLDIPSSWREVWAGEEKGGQGHRHFELTHREALGTPGYWELHTVGPYYGPARIGLFVTREGAMARARRIWRNKTCYPDGAPCGCADITLPGEGLPSP